MIGLYFAIMFAANSLGPVVTGWLISRVSKRLIFIIGATVGTPALFFLGLAQNMVQVIALTSLVWFSGGVVMSLVSIFTGLHTKPESRGKAYSLMAMVGPLGSLVGGATLGHLVSWKGYPMMFAVLALAWTLIPLIGWLGLKDDLPDKAEATPVRPSASRTASSAPLGNGFTRVLAIFFLGSISVNVVRLGSSLSMQAASFSPEAVSSANMIAGLVAIPFTLMIGTLADRLGSKHFLFVSYLLMVSSTLILVNAADTWQFWLASILNMLAFSVSGAMSQALTSEVVSAPALSRGLSWLSTFGAGANIICFAAGGVLFDLLGLPTVFLMTALVALTAGVSVEAFIHTRTSASLIGKRRAVKEASVN